MLNLYENKIGIYQRFFSICYFFYLYRLEFACSSFCWRYRTSLIPFLHDKDIYKKYSYQLNEEGRKSFDSFLEKGDDIESSFQAWILEEISDKDFVQHIKFVPDKEDCYAILPVIILGDYCERYE